MKAEDQALLAGVGVSKVGRRLDASALQLTLDAVRVAVADAGLEMADIDGMATYPGATVSYVPGFVGPDLYEVQDALGLDLGWHLGVPQGAAQIAPLIEAVLAVGAGLCRNAVVFRTVTEASGQAGRGRGGVGAALAEAPGPFAWLLPVGALSAANWAALSAARYLHDTGASREQLSWIARVHRAHAGRNPSAVYTEPLSFEEYMGARMISDPLCLYDCDVPVDGATAVVVSRADQRHDLRHPVRIEAMGTAIRDRPFWDQRRDLTTMAAHDAAAQMWTRTDLEAEDVDVALLYDGFSILTVLWLEAMGFCGRGEALDFVAGGSRVALDGALPLNPHGGQLSAGRLHGWGFVAEAIVQIRGEGAERQVDGASVAAVGVGGGPVGGAILLTV